MLEKKYDEIIMISIIAAVSVILITSLLVPIINDASSQDGTETIEVEGGYCSVTLRHPSSDVEWDTYIRVSYNSSTDTYFIQKDGLSPQVRQNLNRSEIADKTAIIYADPTHIIYIKDDMYYCNDTSFIPAEGITTSHTELLVQKNTSGIKYSLAGFQLTGQPVPSYYYVYDDDGEYANFEGSDPPAMDTPAVSIDGAYIGEKVRTITTTVDSPYSSILNIIPILMIAGVIMSIAGVILYKRM